MDNLTKRELEILQLIFDEVSTVDIAQKLKISKRTVDSHRRNILQKTGTTNLLSLFKYTLKNNLIKISK